MVSDILFGVIQYYNEQKLENWEMPHISTLSYHLFNTLKSVE